VREPAAPVFPEPTQAALDASRLTLERLLRENLLPFWLPGALDREHGGYRLNHDVRGRWKGPASKHLVSQARTLWFFARLAGAGIAPGVHREAAEHGHRFLRERLWDERFGGLFWEVGASGREVRRDGKHLYGQSFGLYALSEHAMASGDAAAARLAGRLFELLETRAHDPRHGGYRECFRRDWSPLPEDEAGPLGAPAGLKLMNTHLHLLESITRYFRLSRDPVARERVFELISVMSDAVVHESAGVYTDRFRIDWTPLRGPAHDRTSYGHQLEGIWLLAEACRAVGVPPARLLGRFRSLFGHALRWGFDRERGGFYDSGPLAAPADRRSKLWWVQAEALVAALEMHALTGEPGWLGCFLATLDWVVRRQADWVHGDWHARVDPETGAPSGDKAGAWKSPYHAGRAVLECLERLPARGGAAACSG
jgi:mannobiose 2-epimerase